jgi:hypothetical protein
LEISVYVFGWLPRRLWNLRHTGLRRRSYELALACLQPFV